VDRISPWDFCCEGNSDGARRVLFDEYVADRYRCAKRDNNALCLHEGRNSEKRAPESATCGFSCRETLHTVTPTDAEEVLATLLAGCRLKTAGA
jgi:hypothetical protein